MNEIFFLSLVFCFIFLCCVYSSKSVYGKDDSYDGNEVYETVDKKNAYKTTGYRFPGFPISGGSSSSSSSSSSSNYGYGGASQSSASASSSSSSGAGFIPAGYFPYQSNVQLAPYGDSNNARYTVPPPPPPSPPQSYRDPNYGRVTLPPTNPSACTSKPKSILNAELRGNSGGNIFMVNCMKNYQFPNGETKAKMICTNNEWALENQEWNDQLACERKQ